MSTWIAGKGTIPAVTTNYDRIIRKTPEELADYFSELTCFPGANRDICKGVANCMDCWLDWLKLEATE